jgi:hypothetical protein
MNDTNETQTITDEIREAVQSGADVHAKIKAITLKALTSRELDTENIKSVVDEVSSGIHAGMTSQSEHAKEIFGHAASAVDDALAVAAEASKLAIEEAASKVNEFSEHELNQAFTDLQNMEGMFLESLEKAAKGGNRMVADIFGDFISHARQSGTVVGKQTAAALEALKKLPHWGKDTVISNTVAATITLAEIGGGILSGIAESLKTPHPKK